MAPKVSPIIPSRILLDLTALKTIDSSGLGAIIDLLKRLGVTGELKLFGLLQSVKKVVRLTRMDRIRCIAGPFEGFPEFLSPKAPALGAEFCENRKNATCLIRGPLRRP